MGHPRQAWHWAGTCLLCRSGHASCKGVAGAALGRQTPVSSATQHDHSFLRRNITCSNRGFCTGSLTLTAVVRELQRQGRLQDDGSSNPSMQGSGVVNIDAAFMQDLALQQESEEEEPLARKTTFEADVDTGTDDPEPVLENGNERDFVPVRPAAAFEDVTLLSEEELRERVRKSIEELVPEGANNLESDEGNLTPAQLFYLENRERMVSRAQDYYLQKQKEHLQQQEEPLDIEDEWRFYHDPVVRPPKGHLWATGADGEVEEHRLEDSWRETAEAWPEGVLPTPEMLAALLEEELAKDVNIVDLVECGRHDIGTHAVIATGITTRHCRRLGDIASKAVQLCKVPHVSAFCYGARQDEWVVAHCGPIKVHIFTKESREDYQLELLWKFPEQVLLPGDFPHYYEVYGTAGEAFQNEGGHRTRPLGSWTPGRIPAPFSDSLNDRLTKPDYAAAEDARYLFPGRVVDVGGEVVPRGWGNDGQDEAPESSSKQPHAFHSASPETIEDGEIDTDDEDDGEQWDAGDQLQTKDQEHPLHERYTTEREKRGPVR